MPFEAALIGSCFMMSATPRLARGGNVERLRGGRDPPNVLLFFERKKVEVYKFVSLCMNVGWPTGRLVGFRDICMRRKGRYV